MREIIIGSRGSDLALWQANFLKAELASTGVESSIKIIKTQGDKIQDIGFSKMEGKGFFTKELEEALMAGDIDVAVHSMKDLPTSSPADLVIAGVSMREDPRDLLLIRRSSIEEKRTLSLREGAIVGTSSARRKAQIQAICPDVRVEDLRGNVPTRIKKLNDGRYDAILLAKAGIDRLGLDIGAFKTIALHPAEFVPAPAQGVLAFQCRIDDLALRKSLLKIHKGEVAECTNIERAVLAGLDGGCHLPLGVLVEKDAQSNFRAYVAFQQSPDSAFLRFTYAQSTSHGMAEALLRKIKAD